MKLVPEKPYAGFLSDIFPWGMLSGRIYKGLKQSRFPSWEGLGVGSSKIGEGIVQKTGFLAESWHCRNQNQTSYNSNLLNQ